MIRMVIDTDPGVDDAHAIMIASTHPNVKIEALTTVAGNVPLVKNTINACKILDVLDETAPIYAGCESALVEQVPDAAHVHGDDGMGDAGIPTSKRVVEREHAVLALIRMANENPGELTLVALGPLTNIAMATRLDPTLPSKYKKLVIMGGAYKSMGNTPIPTAEFNIYQDPEAASIVFNTWQDLTMVSWEATMEHGFSAERITELQANDTVLGDFFNKISKKTLAFIREVLKRDMMFAADPLAMAVAIEPDIVTEELHHYVEVERNGRMSRGQTVVDWYGATENPPNTKVVVKIDLDRFFEMFHNALK